MGKTLFLLIIASCLLSACKIKQREAAAHEQKTLYKLTEVWHSDTLLKTPESVIHDPDRDVLYVSNINDNPMQKDGNGFISRLSTSGEILELKWVSGMSSPKGMAIAGNNLYVADVDEIVVIDIDEAVISGKIPAEDAGMLNDLTADASGNVYSSDSQKSRIYMLGNGEISIWLSEGLDRPNGLFWEKDRMLVVSVGSQDFAAIDLQTKGKTVLAEGFRGGDGIACTGTPGYYLVSTWSGEVFLVDPDMQKTSLLDTKEQKINSADIAFIPDKQLLLVPTFLDNRVFAYKLQKD